MNIVWTIIRLIVMIAFLPAVIYGSWLGLVSGPNIVPVIMGAVITYMFILIVLED